MNANDQFQRFSKRECSYIYGIYSEPLCGHLRYAGPRFPVKGYSRQLANLECFIEKLILNEDSTFLPAIGNFSNMAFDFSNLLREFFTSISDFILIATMLPEEYAYNEHINVFIECCQDLNLLDERLRWGDIWLDPHRTYPHLGGISGGELFNNLVRLLREKCSSKAIRTKIYSRRREAYERFQDYCNYVDALFDYSNLLTVVRIDLGYKEKNGQMDTSSVKSDWDRLYANKRNNSLFSDLVGYIVKIEYDIAKGIHLHAILFFDGAYAGRNNHIFLPDKIGRYWENIVTQGHGLYWSGTNNSDHFIRLENCGIGLIRSDDSKSRNTLLNIVVRYLCKSDQFFKPKFAANVKLLRRGQFPKRP